jgi:cell division protein FtsA
MKLNEPYLIIELNDSKIIFFVISYDEDRDYKLIKNIIVDSDGILNGRIIDVAIVTKLIKKIINSLEDEMDHFFSKASIVINPKNVNSLNISGYKKLNGAQVSKGDIAYILNDIKKIISLTENKYSVIHLFNSSFSLDSDNLENLPIGLFGEFYNQNMTFFLVQKNILKNIKLVFNNCGINIDRIILKPFVEGINFLLKYKNHKNFTVLTIEGKNINISIFKNKSYVLTQDFDFGADLIIKDISKLCSLKINEVEFFLKEINLNSEIEIDADSCLNKKFFSTSPYRKIKHQLILDIITARLDELVEICYENNKNLDYFRKSNNAIYVIISKDEHLKNIQFALQKNRLMDARFIFGQNVDDNLLFSLNGAAELIGRGWEKEAIPVIQPNKSLISNFFSRLFS